MVKSSGKNLVYPIFLQCSNHAPMYYKSIFEDMAYGKCPRGIFIMNYNILSSKRDVLIHSFNDKTKTIQDIVDTIITILQKYTNIAFRNKRNIPILTSDIQTNKWSSLKNKTQRELLIINYVLRLRTQHNLDWIKTMSLLRIINYTLLVKTHTSDDIEMKRGEIYSIKDIVYKNGIFINLRLSDTTKFINVDEEHEEDKMILHYWFYYLQKNKSILE